MKIKKIFFIMIIFSFLCFISSCTKYYEINKRQAKKLFASYNETYDINLPNEFEIIKSYSQTAIDGFEDFLVVKVDKDYKLKYHKQCDCGVHDEFDILWHFNEINNNSHHDLSEVGSTLSSDYDWFAYENLTESKTRTDCLFIIRDNETNYLFVYFVRTQIIDLF